MAQTRCCRFAALLGFRPDELVEQSLSRLISPEETREFTAALREVVAKGVTRNFWIWAPSIANADRGASPRHPTPRRTRRHGRPQGRLTASRSGVRSCRRSLVWRNGTPNVDGDEALAREEQLSEVVVAAVAAAPRNDDPPRGRRYR